MFFKPPPPPRPPPEKKKFLWINKFFFGFFYVSKSNKQLHTHTHTKIFSIFFSILFCFPFCGFFYHNKIKQMHTHTHTLENMTNNNTYRRAMKEIFGIVIGGEKKNEKSVNLWFNGKWQCVIIYKKFFFWIMDDHNNVCVCVSSMYT